MKISGKVLYKLGQMIQILKKPNLNSNLYIVCLYLFIAFVSLQNSPYFKISSAFFCAGGGGFTNMATVSCFGKLTHDRGDAINMNEWNKIKPSYNRYRLT